MGYGDDAVVLKQSHIATARKERSERRGKIILAESSEVIFHNDPPFFI